MGTWNAARCPQGTDHKAVVKAKPKTKSKELKRKVCTPKRRARAELAAELAGISGSDTASEGAPQSHSPTADSPLAPMTPPVRPRDPSVPRSEVSSGNAADEFFNSLDLVIPTSHREVSPTGLSTVSTPGLPAPVSVMCVHCGRALPASIAVSSVGPTCADAGLRCFSVRKRIRTC